MMRSCAVIFIWRGVIRSEHETSILHTCSLYCELSISLFVEVGNKDSFVYYRKVICIMVFAYFIHEDTILPCAPFFMKGRSSHMYGRRGGKKSHFQFVSVRATHIKQFGSEHNKARERGLTVWRDKSDFCSLSINSSSMHTMLHYYRVSSGIHQ